ncbi:MAG: hypothetical protein E7157_01450 [Lactobacillales bacterium]|nr:hypothetical protein [Lactobacillales bacterium]
MEKLEKIKKFLLAILTFICMLVLMTDIVLFSLKKTSEKYLKEEKIKEIVENINVIDLFKDKDGKELEEFTQIKDKIVDSGIPKEAVDSFINSDPVNKYASDTINKAIDNVLENKQEKVIDSNSLNTFFENNMDSISKELQEKNVPKSEYLTKENQQKILNKIKEKTPYIEEKIDAVSNKISEKLGFDYTLKISKMINLFELLYTKLLDFLLIIVFIIFIMGICITRQSIYKSLKWIGITFVSSSIILYCISFIIPKIYKYIDKVPVGFNTMIKKALEDSSKNINSYGLIYLIIGVILTVINIVIYYILLKRENKKFKI